MSAKGNSEHFRRHFSYAPRPAQVRAARRVAGITGLPVEEVFARWRAGLRWCSAHGWENAEQARTCNNARCLARYHAKKGAAQ